MNLQLLALQVQCSFWGGLTYKLARHLDRKLAFGKKGQFLFGSTAHTASLLWTDCMDVWNQTLFHGRILMTAYLAGERSAEVIWNG